MVEWAAENVRLARSSRSTFCDLRQTPWLIGPLEALVGHGASEIVLKAPVGSGKTTLLEVFGCYIVAEKPGPTMFAGQGDSDAGEWMKAGLMPALKACPLIQPLWPTDRHAAGNSAIFFPHMPLFVCGANLSNFQARSLQYAVCDEAWLLRKGLANELRRRNHDRFGAKVFFCGQAGSVGDDFEEAFEACEIREFHFLCPSCSTRQPWQWGNLKWDEPESPRYECGCGHVWNDSPQERRSMCDSGEYVAIKEGIAGHVAFHYTALSVWWVSWDKLVREWISANEAKKRGDLAPLRQFLQKRLAQAWTDEEYLEAVPINTGGYKLGESGQWDVTILTVDVQKDEYWFIVRTWNRAGESRLLDRGKLLHFHDIEAKRSEWNIRPKAVFLDSAYRVEEVKAALAKYGWLGLNGRGEDSFPVTDRRGNKFRRIYSLPIRHQTANGEAINTNFSSAAAKDVLQILKQGHGTAWSAPEDVGQQYLDSLNSEVKKQTAKGMGWVQVKSHNHYFDLEAMQIIGAMMHKVYPLLTSEPEVAEAA